MDFRNVPLDLDHSRAVVRADLLALGISLHCFEQDLVRAAVHLAKTKRSGTSPPPLRYCLECTNRQVAQRCKVTLLIYAPYPVLEVVDLPFRISQNMASLGTPGMYERPGFPFDSARQSLTAGKSNQSLPLRTS